MPSYPSITTKLVNKLGSPTSIAGKQFNAVFRQYFEYGGGDDDPFQNPEMLLNMSTDAYDAEQMQTDVEVHRIDDDTRWLIREPPHVQDGVVIMRLVKKVA